MLKTLRTTLLAATTVVIAGLPPATAGEFTDAQKKEIGEIVRQYLLEHPDILIEMSQKLEQRQKEAKAARAEAALKAHGKALFSGEGDLVIGNPQGKVKMVEFFDYNCGFCKRSLPDVIRLKDTNPDLKIIIKEFPILGPGSLEAARYALAARKQGMDKYWKFHAAMLKHKGRIDGKVALALAKKSGLDVERLRKDAEGKDIAEILGRNMSLADALDINGTPAFVIGDEIVPGALGYKRLNDIIAKVRERGCKNC